MALLSTVRYPGGERVIATGYPHTLVIVLTVPRGPEACLFDELELEPLAPEGLDAGRVVRRIAAGPRRRSSVRAPSF